VSRREIELARVSHVTKVTKDRKQHDFDRAVNALEVEVNRIQQTEPAHSYTRFSLLKLRPELLWEIKRQMSWGAELPIHWFPFAVTFDGRIYRKYWFGWVRTGLTRKSLINACESLNSAR
jgi:hypothetical protein